MIKLICSICKMILLFELFVGLILLLVIAPLGFQYAKIVCFIDSMMLKLVFSVAFFLLVTYLVSYLGRKVMPLIRNS